MGVWLSYWFFVRGIFNWKRAEFPQTVPVAEVMSILNSSVFHLDPSSFGFVWNQNSFAVVAKKSFHKLFVFVVPRWFSEVVVVVVASPVLVIAILKLFDDGLFLWCALRFWLCLCCFGPVL